MNVWALSWKLSQNKPRQFWIGAVLWWCFFCLPTLTGFLIAQAFSALSDLDSSGVYWAAVFIFSSEMLRMATLYWGAVYFIQAWELQQALLRANMLSAQVASGTAEAGRPVASAGGAITRFRDDPRDVAEFIDSWVDVAGGLLFTIATLVVLGSVAPTATAVVLLPLASVAIVVRLLDERIKAYRTADRAATVAFTGLLGDVLASAVTIEVNDAGEAVVDELGRLADRRRHTAVRDRVLEEGLNAFSTGSADIALALVLIVSVGAIQSGDLGASDLALFASYLAFLNFLPRMLGRMIARRKQSTVAYENMRQLVGQQDPARTVTGRPLPIDQPDVQRPVPPERARVRLEQLDVQNIAATYPAGGGLAEVSFTARRGSFTVVTGPVGSGKTTLLRVILGLENEAEMSGQVLWNGKVIEDRAAFLVPPNAAFLPQVPRLLSDSVRGNISMGAPEVGDDLVLEAVRLAALAPDLDAMSAGLDTLIGPRGMRLSGGQRQRVATARALVRQPELLVLDDLSSALDVETELELWQNLARTEVTIIAVSHRRTAMELADQIVELRPRSTN